jgi:homoserine dehydrogenase
VTLAVSAGPCRYPKLQYSRAFVNLVLVGFGNVARAFVRLLDDRARCPEVLDPPQARVVGIATARHGCIVGPDGIDAEAAAALIEAGERLHALQPAGIATPRDTLDTIARAAALDRRVPLVMIETTRLDVRDGEPAATHVRAALTAGAHVITANKGPIACAWPALRDLAARHRRHLLFEGVVMDGIPVFNLVRETLPALTVTRLRGIVNTTTNFLIAALEEGRSFDDALEEMQARGIAESDATLDVDGWDAAAKAAALANVLMDAGITPMMVDRTGVGGLTAGDARAARDAGGRLKLLMEVRREGGRVLARVSPQRLTAADVLATANGTMNALTISTDRLGDITVVQHGGSLVETAYALLSDLVTLRRRIVRDSESA